LILGIEREWGKHPGWFAGLSREQQVLLMADHRLAAKDATAAAGRRRR